MSKNRGFIGFKTGVGLVAMGLATTAAPVTGDPLSLTILNGTSLNGINPNGWVGEITFKGLSTGSILDGSKVSMQVDSPGFNSSGAAITVTRTVVGTAHLRMPLPALHAAGQAVLAGDRRTTRVASPPKFTLHSIRARRAQRLRRAARQGLIQTERSLGSFYIQSKSRPRPESIITRLINKRFRAAMSKFIWFAISESWWAM